ncbi:MAG: T9SS type A sorting domain-containing protein [Lewinellaceae bacterium]|nr:T9SS type A sorting domain-containing protein [Saprospiraceae bacterium]MCB9339459.1 T9SS type A sorting domain-containing protein [Lewinellaceae bacterium]
MKKSFFLLFFTLFFFGLNAQDFYVVDSLYCHTYDNSLNAYAYLRQYNLDFTADGEVLESRQEAFLPWLGQWQNSMYQTYTYDGQNNLIEQVEQHWDTVAVDWINFKRTQNTPNQNGDYTEVLNQEWANGAWQNVDKVSSTFNAQGHIEILTQQLWENGNWRNNFRIIYATNGEGKIVQTKFQLWDLNNNSYYDVNRQTYTYDPQQLGLETERLTEIFNPVNSQWEKSSQNLKGYDSNGNPTEETVQLWDNVDSSWLNQNRTVQNFNPNKQVTLRTELLWTGDQWTNYFQTDNIYDANANLVRFELSGWQTTQWVLVNSCDFYVRFHHVVAAKETVQPVFCEIPNPLSPGQSFYCQNLPPGQIYQLAIYDLNGNLVQIEKVENQGFINIADPLPNGLYVATLYNERGIIFTQKLIISK